jgi:hypothetical protein
MQKINYLICLTAFLALVATTNMARTVNHQATFDDHHQNSIKKLQETYCSTATIVDNACHSDRCHNTTTHIHDCDTYNGDSCDNITTHIDICNATVCHNTTRRIDACYSDVSDQCGNADFTFHCCTNGVCRNRTTHIHACYDTGAINLSFNRAAASLCAADSVCNIFYDPVCVDQITSGFQRRLRSIRK